MKRVIFTLATLAFFGLSMNSALAQNIITLTWQAEEGSLEKVIEIAAPAGETYTVNWGDGTTPTTETGIGDWQTLSHTYAAANSYDVTITGDITVLNCSDNSLTDLDVSKNTELIALYCYVNSLTALDVSKNTALTLLYCYGNSLTDLDVSKNTALTWLDCGYNFLTVLDVSKNTELIALYCAVNSLTVLDVSKNTALTWLSCSNNFLTALDVSKNTALTGLNCGYNSLTVLDVSKNTALTWLGCGGNSLTVLDVSKNTALTGLSCGGNSLTVLDVSKNTALTWLYCDGNSLTVLDVSKNTALAVLSCFNNHLPLPELYELSEQLKDGEAYLGSQTLPPMTVKIDTEQFADQSTFGGEFTEYAITPATGYTIANGKLTFTELGDYEVTMTNAAILSHTDYPAEVRVIITVTESGEGIVETDNYPSLRVYPNPVNEQLTIDNGELTIENVKIYDIMGKTLMSLTTLPSPETTIDVSHLTPGIYFLRIGNKTAKFVKE